VHRIVSQQAAANPGDPSWQRGVSVAEAKLGDLYALTGDKPGARRHYESARAIRAGLAVGGDLPAQVDLAQILVKLGDVSPPKEAGELFARALGVREGVLKAKPRDPNAARDVRVSHSRLAEWHLTGGDPAAARTHAQKAVTLAEALAKAYPKSSQLKQDVATSRAKLGDVYRAEDRKADAAKQYQAAVEAVAPLAAGNPRDLLLQVTHGLYLAHTGRLTDAAAAAARVREQAPDNAFLLYNAACVYAVAAEVAGEKPEADRTPEERKLAAGYGEDALGCLRAALAAGFADHDLVRTDRDLAAARARPGFAEVARGLRPATAGR
jgi:hypothetical protein